MEINNRFYTMNPNLRLLQIDESQSLFRRGELSEEELLSDIYEYREAFYEECYEKAEELGYARCATMASLFMDDFDKQAGIEKIVEENGWKRRFIQILS